MKRTINAAIIMFFAVFALVNIVHATDGGWGVDADGNWSTASNWSFSTIADGAGANGNFGFDITADRVVTIDGAIASRTLGGLFIGDSNDTNRYTIAASGGGTLTFDNTPNSANADLFAVSTSKGDTITAPILLKSSLTIRNTATDPLAVMTLSTGGIQSSATSGTQQLLFASGKVLVTDVIGNGGTGGTVSVFVTTASSVVSLNAANSYTGGTIVREGTLQFNNGAALGSGPVTVGTPAPTNPKLLATASVTLTNNITVVNSIGTQTIGGSGAVSPSFNGALTLNGDVLLTSDAGGTASFNNSITGVGAITKIGAGTVVLNNAFNDYTGGTTIAAGTLRVAKIGNASGSSDLGTGGTINFGSGATTGTLAYIGAGETSNKVINLSGTTGGATIDTTGATGGLTFSSNFTATGAGAKTLTLQGNSTGNSITGTIGDSGGGATALTKSGTGTWTLSNTNSYSGGTTINGGTLIANANGALGTGNVSLTASSVTLTLQNGGATNNYISDSASISIATSAVTNLNYTLGQTDIVGGITLGGAVQTTPGTYGSTSSGADFQSAFFAGTGTLTLIPEPSTSVLIGIGLLLGAQRLRRKIS